MIRNDGCALFVERVMAVKMGDQRPTTIDFLEKTFPLEIGAQFVLTSQLSIKPTN
jgi:hypothetical protein